LKIALETTIDCGAY